MWGVYGICVCVCAELCVCGVCNVMCGLCVHLIVQNDSLCEFGLSSGFDVVVVVAAQHMGS